MVYELAGAPSRSGLWTLWPAAVLSCLSSKFPFSFVQGQRPGSSKLSRKQPLWNLECSSRRIRLSLRKAFSCMGCFSLPLYPWLPSVRMREQCGYTIPDSDLWVILNPVLVLDWIFFWLAMWPLPEGKQLLHRFVKMRKSKATSSLDNSSGLNGIFSLGPLSCS